MGDKVTLKQVMWGSFSRIGLGVITMLIAGILLTTNSGRRTMNDDYHRQLLARDKLASIGSVEQRESAAQLMLFTADKVVDGKIDDKTRAMLTAVSRTGVVPAQSNRLHPPSEVWRALLIGLLVALGLYCCVMTAALYELAGQYVTFIVDIIPWRKRWAISMVAITSLAGLPLLVYLASAARRWSYRQVHGPRQAS
jgi:hypothetical protein